MIIIQEGSAEMLPWVQVEISIGRWPFQWGFEVLHFDPKIDVDGSPVPGWVHDWQKDGGGYGFWNVMRKAERAMDNLFVELLPEPTPEMLKSLGIDNPT